MKWRKRPYYWKEGKRLCVSIPFTWNLPEVYDVLSTSSRVWEEALVGGPAVELMPNYFNGLPWVEIGYSMPGILQRINFLATRTTTGCIHRCKFCGVGWGRIEPGGFQELKTWPNLPIVCDNNLLVSSLDHFDKVIEGLKTWGWADFEQGLDCRLLNDYHAKKFKEIGKPMIRLALDHSGLQDDWLAAYEHLRTAGLPKIRISSYVLIGFDSPPDEAWQRCRFVERQGVRVNPQWYHSLTQLKYNEITEDQKALGWTERELKNIMGWFYWRRRPQL